MNTFVNTYKTIKGLPYRLLRLLNSYQTEKNKLQLDWWLEKINLCDYSTKEETLEIKIGLWFTLESTLNMGRRSSKHGCFAKSHAAGRANLIKEVSTLIIAL